MQGFETIAEIQIESEGFVANGLQIVARNYLEVYPYDRWSDKSLPQFSEGQRFEVVKELFHLFCMFCICFFFFFFFSQRLLR